jgi:hypothetical protein
VKIAKENELGFQEIAAILSPLSIYGHSRKTKTPLKPNRIAPSDGCPTTALRVASTQALRSRRVSSASKLLGAPGSRLRPLSLRSWFCGSTK